MKKRVLTIFNVVLGIVLTLVAFRILSNLLVPVQVSNISTGEAWNSFYQEEADTVDVLYIGPSTIYYGISPTEIYDRIGITGYDLSSPKQKMIFSKYYLQEALKTQKPKLVVVENTLYLEPEFDKDEPFFRTAVDHVKLSPEKLLLAGHIIRNSDRQSFLSYVFPFMRFHDRWREVEFSRDTLRQAFSPYSNNYLKGFATVGSIEDLSDRRPIYMTDSGGSDPSFSSDNLKLLEEMNDICVNNGATLLLVRMPMIQKPAKQDENFTFEQSRATAQICARLGIQYLDFNTEQIWNEIGFNLSEDFSSASHMNVIGSDKVCCFLAKYLKDHYEFFPEHDEKLREKWDEAVVETRKALIGWLQGMSNNAMHNAGMFPQVKAEYEGNREVVISWPMMSYIERMNLYKQMQDGSEKLLFSTESETAYTDQAEDCSAQYDIEYFIRDMDTPLHVGFGIIPPISFEYMENGIMIRWDFPEGCDSFALKKIDSANRETVLADSPADGWYLDDGLKQDATYMIEYTINGFKNTYSFEHMGQHEE